TSAMLALLSVPAFAQGTQPAQPAKPAPAVTAPAPAKSATTGAATAPQVAKTNLNTATAAELDKLPQIGPARSKAIIEARAKAKFKNWDDFMARKVVPADAAAAIMDVVSFGTAPDRAGYVARGRHRATRLKAPSRALSFHSANDERGMAARALTPVGCGRTSFADGSRRAARAP